MGERVIITEVGPRDGLQNERVVPPTEAKVAFVDALTEAGCPSIEVTSFVHPRRVPAMADAERVFELMFRRPGTRYIALTPNLRGYERAVAVGCDTVAVFTAASEAFVEANINMTIARSLAAVGKVTERAAREGVDVRGYVSTVLACPYAGAVAPGAVVEVAGALIDVGCYEVSLGDTIGVGTPADVRRLLDAVLPVVPAERVVLHLHDTWGMAIANVMVGLEYGVRRFDASAGGLGGCPFAPGATGNLATEDLVYLLDALGYETGVDLEGVASAAQGIGGFVERRLPSRVHHAVLARRLRDERQSDGWERADADERRAGP